MNQELAIVNIVLIDLKIGFPAVERAVKSDFKEDEKGRELR